MIRRPLTYNGRTLSMTEWSRETAIPLRVISGRIARGWSVESTLTTSVEQAKNQVRDQMQQRGLASKKHGMFGTPTYQSWNSMIQRCRNKKTKAYPRYGGRGILVCAHWIVFANFFADMGLKPEGKELDRKNNDGNYEPGNCRWATLIEQANNRRSNVFLEFEGQRHTAAEWGRILNLKPLIITKRIHRGWSVKEALYGR